jgi:signal transduction histidine kinase
MSYISMSTPLVESILKDGQAILIAHPESDSRVPLKMQKFGLSCLLVIPLVTQTGEDSKFLGLISLARKEGAAFTQDEVVRMTMISDHIANLIDSDRRRKLAIALSERQKLLRDLHDSVSQKLYGLVTLTEAAQAGLEAGSSVDPSPLLKKIGESARQAVKEMRLFLYQLQPIEVEKDGLVSVLHHRLASVEGRADIKARLLADEDISLTTQQEVALYFIAQEALNNILRHAQAKSIEIKLLQGPRNVNLEIVDDGHGFDPKKVEPGGMGLRNMKERTLQINGKFKLVSNPDQGTRINVSVPRDQSTKSYKQKRRRRKS